MWAVNRDRRRKFGPMGPKKGHSRVWAANLPGLGGEADGQAVHDDGGRLRLGTIGWILRAREDETASRRATWRGGKNGRGMKHAKVPCRGLAV
jgi:hypothetical protein